MNRFTLTQGGASIQCTLLRRFYRVRFQPSPTSSALTIIRPYYPPPPPHPHQQQQQQQPTMMGGPQPYPTHPDPSLFAPYPPPPPPPGMYPAYPYYMNPMPQQQPSGPQVGTRERPMIVTAAPTPMSFTSYLWIVMLLLIGMSALLQIYGEYESRQQSQAMQKGAIASMLGVQEVKPVDLSGSDIDFDSVRGCDEAKEELQEIVQFLKNPKKFVELGGRLPKGALLVGPPGCGKTMLAKAIAKEAGVKFFYASGSEFEEMFVGVGARRVRELFAAAKANAPALIFIDEIDSLGGRRGAGDHSHSRMSLNQLLAEMDGFQSSEEVIVLAATNTPDMLDKALTRPGRFDTTIAIDPPDLKGRNDILDGYLKKIKHDLSVNALNIARGTSGFTGAELSNLINVAAIRAAVLDKTSVSNDEIEYAKDRVMMGAENRTKVVPESEKRITAYHEGGHALVAILLENEGCDPVHKATIVPRGSGIMGLVQQQPHTDKYSQTRRQCLSRLKVCLAGRVAEEMILGNEDVTTGASSDFQQATRMARAMVRRFGFGDMGTIDFESADSAEGAYLSDGTKQKIENEIHSIVRNAYTETKTLLSDNRKKLDALATQLLRHETLTGEELKRILAGETIPDKIKAEKKKTELPKNSPPPPPKGGQKIKVEVSSDEPNKNA